MVRAAQLVNPGIGGTFENNYYAPAAGIALFLPPALCLFDRWLDGFGTEGHAAVPFEKDFGAARTALMRGAVVRIAGEIHFPVVPALSTFVHVQRVGLIHEYLRSRATEWGAYSFAKKVWPVAVLVDPVTHHGHLQCDVPCVLSLSSQHQCGRTIMFDTSSPMKVGDFDMQRVKTMFDTSTGRSLPSSKFATIKFDTTPRAFRSHVTGCYRP
jgi:hypothetical protein